MTSTSWRSWRSCERDTQMHRQTVSVLSFGVTRLDHETVSEISVTPIYLRQNAGESRSASLEDESATFCGPCTLLILTCFAAVTACSHMNFASLFLLATRMAQVMSERSFFFFTCCPQAVNQALNVFRLTDHCCGCGTFSFTC